MIVAVYTPENEFDGMSIEIVGFHIVIAALSPLTPLAVTAGTGALRSLGSRTV